MTSLRNRAIKGINWSIINNLAKSGITFLVGIILARLLSPVEFGILGMVMIFIAVSDIIIEGGFVTALIRKTDATDEDYNTVFYCNLAISFFMMLVLWLTSSIIARFFDEPILKSVIPCLSLLLVINASAIIHQTIFTKNLDFKVQAIISLISSLGGGLIGIGLALMNFKIWSLVVQQLARQLIMALLLWFSARWRPKWLFSKKSFQELFRFGSKLLVGNLINTLYRNIFLAVIGKMYSAAQLGQYNRAEQFNLILTNNLANVIQKVSMPTLSQIKNDEKRLVFLFRKILLYSSIVTFSAVFGLAALARPLILTLVGKQWLVSAKYLQIMCCYGVLYIINQLNLNMLSIYGRSDLLLKLEIIKKFIFIPVLIIGCYYELQYMLWAAVVYYYIETVANSWYAEKLFGYGLWKQVKDLSPIFLLSFAVSLCMWSVTLLSIQSVPTLILQISIGLILYISIYEIISHPEYKELKNIIIDNLRRLYIKT